MTSKSFAVSLRTTSGTSATRVSPAAVSFGTPTFMRRRRYLIASQRPLQGCGTATGRSSEIASAKRSRSTESLECARGRGGDAGRVRAGDEPDRLAVVLGGRGDEARRRRPSVRAAARRPSRARTSRRAEAPNRA